jgi:hypothetical protein
LGKLFKTNILVLNNGVLNDLDFIKNGIDIFYKFKNNSLNCSFNEKLEILNILCMFKDVEKHNFKKYILYKDATASGIQLLTVILGASNENILKICNLNSTEY